MPSRSATSSHAAASRGRSSKSASSSAGSPSMAHRSKGRSANGNRAKRELAGGLKTTRSAGPIDDNEIESDEDAELEMTEGKLRKQAEQRWSARMLAIAPHAADSDQGEGEGEGEASE